MPSAPKAPTVPANVDQPSPLIMGTIESTFFRKVGKQAERKNYGNRKISQTDTHEGAKLTASHFHLNRGAVPGHKRPQQTAVNKIESPTSGQFGCMTLLYSLRMFFPSSEVKSYSCCLGIQALTSFPLVVNNRISLHRQFW